MLRNIAHNFLAQLVSPVLAIVDRLVVFGLLIRAWGPDVYADYAVALSAAGLLTLTESGLNIYFGNMWQQACAAGDEPKFQRTVGVALSIYGGIVAGLVLLVAVLLVSGALTRLLSFHRFDRPEAQHVFALLAMSAIVRLARGSLSQIYRGRGAFARGTLVAQAQTGVGLCVVTAAAIAGASPTVLAGVDLLNELILGWGFLLFDLRRRFSLRLSPVVPTRDDMTTILRLVPWFGVQQGAPIVGVQVPVLVMGALGVAATSLVGFVNLRTLVNIGRLPVSLLSIATGVEFAMAHFRDRSRSSAARLMAAGQMASVLTAVIAVAILAFGQNFVALWTGRVDLFDMKVAAALVAGAIVAAPSVPIVNFLSFVNEPRPVAMALLLQIVVACAAIVMLTPRHGAFGAALGLFAGEMALAVAVPLLTNRLMPFRFREYLPRCFASACLAGAWSWAVAALLVHQTNAAGAAGFVVLAAGYALLAVAPCLVAGAPSALRRRAIAAIRMRAASPPVTETQFPHGHGVDTPPTGARRTD